MGSKKKTSRPAGAASPPAAPTEVTAAPGWLGAKGPALRFVLICGALMLLFYGVFYTPPEDSPALDAFILGYLGAYARAARAVLALLGFDAQVSGTTIYIANRGVEVVRGCDAMEPIAFFMAAVIAVPVRWRAKLVGLGLGVPLLVLLNLVRIVALTLVSVKFPAQFETAHVTVGQAVFILGTLALWFAWVIRASREGKDARAAARD